MGGENNDVAALTHLILSLSGGHGLHGFHGHSWRYPGMHMNLFIHGILGILHYQSGRIGLELEPAYKISLAASRYLPLPCYMADNFWGEKAIGLLHAFSGLIPFFLAATGKENKELGKVCIIGNIISLLYFSFKRNSEYGYMTGAAAAISYFVIKPEADPGKALYPIGLAVMQHCAYRSFLGGATLD